MNLSKRTIIIVICVIVASALLVWFFYYIQNKDFSNQMNGFVTKAENGMYSKPKLITSKNLMLTMSMPSSKYKSREITRASTH